MPPSRRDSDTDSGSSHSPFAETPDRKNNNGNGSGSRPSTKTKHAASIGTAVIGRFARGQETKLTYTVNLITSPERSEDSGRVRKL